MYTEKVMDHFSNPRNIGEIENADGVGEVGNPVCGDMMSFYINVEDNKIADIKFKTFGCVAAIAVSSMVTEMALGKTLDEAEKMHCSNLGADALTKAIEDFESKQ
jgi:nitrogen fixation NifU-like protein